jgi:GTP-binding protein HflX
MSAREKDDVAKLHKTIRAFFRRGLVKAELFMPWSAQQLRGELFENCEVLEERADTEGTHFRVRGEREDIDGLRERIGQARGILQG